MRTLTIHNLPDKLHRSLVAQAVKNDRSVEAELVSILEKTLTAPHLYNLGRIMQDMAIELPVTEEEYAILSEAYKRTPLQFGK